MTKAGYQAGDWQAVRLTQARQVAQLMDRDPDTWPEDCGASAGYRALRDEGDLSGAIDYLAHALPRLEAITWAARVVEDSAALHPPSPRDRRALDVALRWLGEPTDAHRRAVLPAIDALRDAGPERHLCHAIFYSGGSIAAAAQPPILPPPEAAARYAVSAIRACVYREADRDAAFARALNLGERIAERGMDALAR